MIIHLCPVACMHGAGTLIKEAIGQNKKCIVVI